VIAGLLLLAFVVRALVPQGFMLASEGQLSIEICPDGFPAQLLGHAAHHHHGGAHWHAEHCLFGSASASGPVSHVPSVAPAFIAGLAPAAPLDSAAVTIRLVHLPHVRGPPAIS
jgi:hypothetical protein